MEEINLSLDPLEILGIVGLIIMICFGLQYVIGYLKWRFGAPKYEADNEEEEV